MQQLLNSLTLKVKSIAEKLGIISDFVIEQGTAGFWEYEKWNNGKCILKAYSTLRGVTVSTTYGNLFRSQTYNYTLPSGMLVEIKNAFVGGNLGGTWGAISNASVNSVHPFLVGPFSNTEFISDDYFWLVTVEGKWK